MNGGTMNEMNEKLLELARKTVKEANRILKIPGSEYIKEYGVTIDMVDRSKIEKCQTMLEALAFFMGGEQDG